MADIKDRSLRYGDYVNYHSKEYGSGKGQVIDIIWLKGKRYAIIEPLYLTNERRLHDSFISVEVKDTNRATREEIEKRIRMR